MSEPVDRRVLGAVRFVDATTRLPVAAPLALSAPGVHWIRNRSAAWVVAEAPSLGAYTAAFDPAPAAPPPGDVVVDFTVADPAGTYLPRRGRVRVPRDPAPAGADAPASLFRTVDVALFPSPAAPTWPGWAQIRASVAGPTPGSVLAGALLRVVRTSGVEALIGAGMSDARGEALIAVPGLPATTFEGGDGPVLGTEIPVRIEVVFDEAAAGPFPDPDALEAGHAAHTLRGPTATLAAGRVVAMTL